MYWHLFNHEQCFQRALGQLAFKQILYVQEVVTRPKVLNRTILSN